MLIPIKCFTCNKTLANKYDYYVKAVEELKLKKKKDAKASKKATDNTASESTEAIKAAKDSIYFDDIKTGEILDRMGLTRYCCRRHMLGTVDMMETI